MQVLASRYEYLTEIHALSVQIRECAKTRLRFTAENQECQEMLEFSDIPLILARINDEEDLALID
jgi:hypothetical protein